MSQPNTESKTWIQKTVGVCGGDACIRNTRYTVAGLVEWRRLGLTDDEILEQHALLTQSDLDAAWEHFREHPNEIEQVITDDEDA